MPLPPGFELEQSSDLKAVPDSPRGLPPGFVLESAPPKPTAMQQMQPAISGALKLGTGLAGIPVDAIENVMNLGEAAKGSIMAAVGRPDLAKEPLRGSIGGSEHLQALLRKTGVPLLNPDNPMPKDSLGTAQYDFVARGGVMPGGAVPAIGSQVAEKIGGPQWAGVGAMLPSAAKMAYNEMRAPSLAAEQAKNTVRDQTLREAQAEGFKVIPTQVESGPGKAALESLGGKAAIKQQATIDNQTIGTAIARREIGVPENTPLTMQTLEARKQELAKPYSQLAAVSPNAEYFLRELRDARQKATAYWNEYTVQKTVSSLENYRANDAKATAMEGKLQAEAVKAGKPELVPAMREARQAIAKVWDVERALNLGDGNLDMQKLGLMYDHGAKLSGGLETIAKFAQGPGRQVTGEVSKTPTPHVSKMNVLGSGVGGAVGSAFGPLGTALGIVAPFVAPPAARSVVLSDWYQRQFGTPSYTPAMQPEGSLQSLARSAIIGSQQARQ